MTSPGRPATKVKSTRSQNCFCLTHARAQAAQHTRSVRFCVKTIAIISARFRLISCPLVRSISRGNSKTCSPTRPSHSLTDPDRQSLHTNSTCYACAAAGKTRCWHWLACDVQVHNTLTQAVVRIITRMRDIGLDGAVLKLLRPYSSTVALAERSLESRARLDESRRGRCPAQAPKPAPPDNPAAHRAPKRMGCALPYLPA